ncbi:G-protein coupled receptor, partial [Penaeus vannamei]
DFAVCGNGKRVHRHWWCDGWTDCEDNHADELDCGPCNDRQYSCSDGQCISAGNVCDSQCDCVDCGDEIDCEEFYTVNSGVPECHKGVALTCVVSPLDRKKDRCIAARNICDGFNDCHNGEQVSDEYGCHWLSPFSCIPLTISTSFVPFFPNSDSLRRSPLFSDASLALSGLVLFTFYYLVLPPLHTSSLLPCNSTSTSLSFSTSSAPPPRVSACNPRSSPPPPPPAVNESADCALLEDQEDSLFPCSDGRCLPVHLRCDGKRDCLRGEDEDLCREYEALATRRVLPDDESSSKGTLNMRLLALKGGTGFAEAAA